MRFVRGAQPLSVEQVRLARPCAETAADPGTRSRSGARALEGRHPAPHRTGTTPLIRMQPRSGLVIPAIALITLVLPAPERPNKPDDRRLGRKFDGEAERAQLLLDVNVDHRACSSRERRVSHSDVASATIDRMTAMMLRRKRLAFAARNLRERVDGQRQRLRFARDVGHEGDRRAEFAQPARERQQRSGDDPRAAPAAA